MPRYRPSPTQGDSAETLERAQDVARKLIESYVEHGDPVPSALRKQQKQSLTKGTLRAILGRPDLHIGN